MTVPPIGQDPADTPADTNRPTPDTDRLVTLDVARGVALFGVLLANLVYHVTGPIYAFGPQPLQGIDERTYQFIGAIFAGKFYPLFSFLFGLGVVVMAQRARSARQFVRRYQRRLIGLAVLGILHGVFIFDGDILFTYAMTGFALMFLLGRSLSVMAVVAIACWLGSIFMLAGTGGFPPPEIGGLHPVANSYANDLAYRMLGTFMQIPSLFSSGLLVFAMMIAGAIAGFTGVLTTSSQQNDRVLTVLRYPVLIVGLLLGLPGGWLLHSTLSDVSLLQTAIVLNQLGGPMVAVGLLAWIHRWTYGPTPGVVRRSLEATGTLSLSCYLSQSIVMWLVFSHVGLDLSAHLTFFQSAILAVLFFGLQLTLAVWWKRYFQFGPAEWLLRMQTYGRRYPIRRVKAEY